MLNNNKIESVRVSGSLNFFSSSNQNYTAILAAILNFYQIICKFLIANVLQIYKINCSVFDLSKITLDICT